jgi:hypothetical protein
MEAPQPQSESAEASAPAPSAPSGALASPPTTEIIQQVLRIYRPTVMYIVLAW